MVSVLEQFLGGIEQIPPMYSALKQGGQPLYRLARKGIEVDRKPREITVYSMSLQRYCWPDFTFRTSCSKGAYVRVLVEDIAAALGTLAHVTALRRLEIEPFAGLRMHTFAELEAAAQTGFDGLDGLLLPIERALPDWPALKLSVEHEDDLRHGRSVPADPAWAPGRVLLHGPANEFFGLGEISADGQLLPRRIFSL